MTQHQDRPYTIALSRTDARFLAEMLETCGLSIRAAGSGDLLSDEGIEKVTAEILKLSRRVGSIKKTTRGFPVDEEELRFIEMSVETFIAENDGNAAFQIERALRLKRCVEEAYPDMPGEKIYIRVNRDPEL